MISPGPYKTNGYVVTDTADRSIALLPVRGDGDKDMATAALLAGSWEMREILKAILADDDVPSLTWQLIKGCLHRIGEDA